MMRKEDTKISRKMYFRYQPHFEQEVVALFFLILPDLIEKGLLPPIKVDELRDDFPDMIAFKWDGNDWISWKVEFEALGDSFNHDITKCDAMICWEGGSQFQNKIEVIELKRLLSSLPQSYIESNEPNYKNTIWEEDKFLNASPIELREKHKFLRQELSKLGEIKLGGGDSKPSYSLRIPTPYGYSVKILGVYSNGTGWIDFTSDRLKKLPESDREKWRQIVKSDVGIDEFGKSWIENIPILDLMEKVISAVEKFKTAFNKNQKIVFKILV